VNFEGPFRFRFQLTVYGTENLLRLQYCLHRNFSRIHILESLQTTKIIHDHERSLQREDDAKSCLQSHDEERCLTTITIAVKVQSVCIIGKMVSRWSSSDLETCWAFGLM
jgi:hypothetical protein